MDKCMEIGLVLYPAVHSPSVWGMTDLLKQASAFAQSQALPALRISHWQDQNGHITKTFDTHPDDHNAVNVIILPPSFEPPISPKDAQAYSAWLTQMHGQGAILCAICSGIFTLLETGLLAGRTITTHSKHNDIIRQKWPAVVLDSTKLLIDDNDIITSAGGMSWMDLGLKLVGKIYSSTLMLDFAKYMLLDPPLRAQSYYRAFVPKFDHGDVLIIKVQHWLQANYGTKITLDSLAEHIALEKRTLLRRFKRATGMTVIEYCQNLRIHKAQELLETTSLSFEQIAWQVGYQNSSSFHKIFTKMIGLTSTEYRKRFKS